jgi:hypothetical protein
VETVTAFLLAESELLVVGHLFGANGTTITNHSWSRHLFLCLIGFAVEGNIVPKSDPSVLTHNGVGFVVTLG